MAKRNNSYTYEIGIIKMDLFAEITKAYPELTDEDFRPDKGSILLRNESDGKGDYIAKWNYSKPVPTGLKIGQ